MVCKVRKSLMSSKFSLEFQDDQGEGRRGLAQKEKKVRKSFMSSKFSLKKERACSEREAALHMRVRLRIGGAPDCTRTCKEVE